MMSQYLPCLQLTPPSTLNLYGLPRAIFSANMMSGQLQTLMSHTFNLHIYFEQFFLSLIMCKDVSVLLQYFRILFSVHTAIVHGRKDNCLGS